MAFVVFRDGHKDDPSAGGASALMHSAPGRSLHGDAGMSDELRSARVAAHRTRGSEKEREEIKNLRRELEATKAELEKITRPLGQDVLSSTVNAEIRPSETLVTGGYRTADGNYELTFLTPRGVILEDGREGFEVNAQVLSVGPEFVEAHGMGALATNARNTLQHAEAWMQDDVARTFSAARDAEGVAVLSSPKVITLPSTSFTVGIGETDGAQFSFEGAVARSANGNFAIQSRVERTPKTGQGVVGVPANPPSVGE